MATKMAKREEGRAGKTIWRKLLWKPRNQQHRRQTSMPRRACYSRTCADITTFWSTVSSKRSRCLQVGAFHAFTPSCVSTATFIIEAPRAGHFQKDAGTQACYACESTQNCLCKGNLCQGQQSSQPDTIDSTTSSSGGAGLSCNAHRAPSAYEHVEVIGAFQSASSYQARCLPSSHSKVLHPTRQMENRGNFSRQDIVMLCVHLENMDTLELQLSNLPQLSDEVYCSLVAPITVDELTTAMRHLHRGSALGSDGLTVEFYNAFWDVIGPILCEVLNLFTSRHTLPPSFKNDMIILLPKTQEHPEDPRNWHPITLLETDYKILTTVLTMRLQGVMPSLITSWQSCSVVGRNVQTLNMLNRDITEYTRQSQGRGWLTSLDQAQSFDRVQH
ncbi:hypothetical protein HPB51_010952 [Rhipicephalus microplus]|uniref:Reverse transcriptase domain-containing protein n=1 Tax=Rhipicephalus microplus TaxID=6941 RepID=A0A9J6D557_RHIMP|nr:hypothetical protein HPB51_010952 [Rhipicephalus microplus]